MQLTQAGAGRSSQLYFFHLQPCLAAPLSQCLVPSCYACRRLTPEMLHCVGTSSSCEQSICLHPAVVWRCALQLLHHLAAGIQWLPSYEKYLEKPTSKRASPQKIWYSVSVPETSKLSLLFRWECALEFGFEGQKIPIASQDRGSSSTHGCCTQHQECIQILVFFLQD